MGKFCSECGQPLADSTHIVVIMDMSGSMGGSMWDEALGAYNAFIGEQKKVEGKAEVSLILFDTVLEYPYSRVPIQEVETLTKDVYIPRGATALFDAVDSAVTEHRPVGFDKNEKTLFVIITDGYENASRNVRTSTQIKEIITGAKNRGAQFVFLAADEASFAQGVSMGIGLGNSVNYHGNVSDGMKNLSNNTTLYRSASYTVTDNFFDQNEGTEEEDKQ